MKLTKLQFKAAIDALGKDAVYNVIERGLEDIVIAFLDKKQIQMRMKGNTGCWSYITRPAFCEDFDYRIFIETKTYTFDFDCNVYESFNVKADSKEDAIKMAEEVSRQLKDNLAERLKNTTFFINDEYGIDIVNEEWVEVK